MAIRSLILLTAIVCSLFNVATAKEKLPKYLDHPYMVEQTGSAREGKLVKVYAFGGNADKAIQQAYKDAVAAALFSGIRPSAESGGMGISTIPALVDQKTLNEHLGFFNDFFEKKLKSSGDIKYEYQRFVRPINKEYPTGENNIKTPQGRRVGVYVIVYYEELRKHLQDNYILKSLNDHFGF